MHKLSLLLPLQKSLMKLEHSEKCVWNIFLKKKPVYLKIFNVPSSPKLLKSKELMESRFFQIAIKHEGKILPRKGGKSEILREIFFTGQWNLRSDHFEHSKLSQS